MFKIGDIVRVNPELPNNGNNPNPGTIGRVVEVRELGTDPSCVVEFFYSSRLNAIFMNDECGYAGHDESIRYPGFWRAQWSYSQDALEYYAWGKSPEKLSDEDQRFLDSSKARGDLSPVEEFLVDTIERVLHSKFPEEDFRI